MLTKNTAKGLRIFLILVVITITLILVFTVTEETVSALKKIKWIYLFSSIILLLVYVLLEATRIELLSKTISGHFIRFSSSVLFIFCGAFLSAVTPFQAGGAPVQMYILKKEGMEWDKILTLLLMRGILYILSAFLLSLIFIKDFLSSTPYSIGMLSWYAVITYAVIFGLLIILFSTSCTEEVLLQDKHATGKENKAHIHITPCFKGDSRYGENIQNNVV